MTVLWKTAQEMGELKEADFKVAPFLEDEQTKEVIAVENTQEEKSADEQNAEETARATKKLQSYVRAIARRNKHIKRLEAVAAKEEELRAAAAAKEEELRATAAAKEEELRAAAAKEGEGKGKREKERKDAVVNNREGETANAKKREEKERNTKSSISNYFMTDNVDNIEQRFRDFVKEYGQKATQQFTEAELKKIDKAVIKRAIKKISELYPIPSPQPTAPKISIRTTNALIEVLGKTIKKKDNVKELFDLNNIKITSTELDAIFKEYFKNGNGINKNKISSIMDSESKDNDSENIEFIVNRIAGISKDDLIELFKTSGIRLNEDEKIKLQAKYFEDNKLQMEKLIELYGIK